MPRAAPPCAGGGITWVLLVWADPASQALPGQAWLLCVLRGGLSFFLCAMDKWEGMSRGEGTLKPGWSLPQPERINPELNQKGYNVKSDVWSLGITMVYRRACVWGGGEGLGSWDVLLG